MFSSIKWKFITVYFLLVFIAMVIVGIFIVGRLEDQQIESVTNNMEKYIETIVGTSSYLASDNWLESREEIQNTINEWRLGSNETLYVIYDQDVPIIIASSIVQNEKLIGQNALSYKLIDPTIVLKAFGGEKAGSIIKDDNEETTIKHLAYPVFSSVGKLKGVLYMTSDLENIYNTVNESRSILTNATVLALLITVFLGFLIASSITEPIRDVTKKAEEMAMGDFDQFVEVKSDDEIGQLASMFNHLTLKLKETIQDMDLERSKLDTIFSYMAEGVLAVDMSGHIMHANPIAIDILNLKEQDIYEKNILELDHLSLSKVNYNNISTLEGDEIAEFNSQFYKVKYAPFKNEKSNIGGLIIVFQDITREHKLDNMRKEFVANVSHELKTPITTIKSYAETLMENDIDKDISNRFLEVIDSECDRMARLVRDLLQLSNLDYKKTNWKKTEIALDKVISDIMLKLDLVFKEKKQTVEVHIEENICHVIGDKDGIEQVILNIVSNAIKYTEEHGKIIIDARRVGNNIRISVKDNGIGIPEEDQERIFERFYRVEKGRSRELGGTGLGLSIAKEIIEAHDGHIELNSKFGVGTEIIIELPCNIV